MRFGGRLFNLGSSAGRGRFGPYFDSESHEYVEFGENSQGNSRMEGGRAVSCRDYEQSYLA